MLCDLNTLRNALSLPPGDTSQDIKLVQCLVAADSAVKNYAHRSFETSSWIMEFPWQGGTQDLALLQRPIHPVLGTANIANGSPTLSNITVNPPFSAASILSGMPVAITGAVQPQNLMPAIPPFTTISNLTPSTSPTSCTMSNAATADGTAVPVIFGLDIYIDFGGNYGFGINAYRNGPGNSSRLYCGLDYAPKVDQPDGTSKSGLLVLLAQAGYGGGLWSLAPLGWGFGGMGGYGPYGGPLTQAMPPVWPTYPGAVCVTYAAGVGVSGATAPTGPNSTGGTLTPGAIPYDLTEAVCGVALWMWNNLDSGLIQTGNEAFSGYSRGLQDAAREGLAKAPALGSTRDILSRYMEMPI